MFKVINVKLCRKIPRLAQTSHGFPKQHVAILTSTHACLSVKFFLPSVTGALEAFEWIHPTSLMEYLCSWVKM